MSRANIPFYDLDFETGFKTYDDKGAGLSQKILSDDRDVVAKTHGLYIPPEQTHRLDELYRRYVDPLEKGEAEELQERQYREQYQWFLLPGLLLLIIQAGLSPYRKRAAQLAPVVLVGVMLCLGACGPPERGNLAK